MDRPCTVCGQAFSPDSLESSILADRTPKVGDLSLTFDPPSLCPLCRERRRYAFRNERSLHRRSCGHCGKMFVSMYRANAPWKVFCPSCYFADSWNVLEEGAPFDPERTFFDQFLDLKRRVPRLGIDVLKNENSDYTNISIQNANCYLVFATVRSQSCLYTRKVVHGTDCMDCSYTERSELCYECTDCTDCYNLSFSELCQNCSDASFLYDCRNCRSCYRCSNLHGKSYCIENQQLSEAEYRARIPDLSMWSTLQREILAFEQLKLRTIRRPDQNQNVERCLGNYLTNCADCTTCFELHNSQGSFRCTEATTGSADCMDCSCTTMECERDYNCCTCSNATCDSACCFGCRDQNARLLYCDSCYGCTDCFGCIGLRHAQFCILNVQYTKEDYEALVTTIAEQMRRDSVWGTFFPPSQSPFGYNESMGQEFYPLARETALAQGYSWEDAPHDVPEVSRIIDAASLPERITDIPDEIMDWAIRCPVTDRPFKIVHRELQFYRDHHFPLPRLHPDARHRRRMSIRNPRILYTRSCNRCVKDFVTTYGPSRPEVVYCEQCYLQMVY